MSSVDPPKNASGDRSDDLSCEDGFFAEGWVYCIPNRYNDQYADMKGIWDKGWMNKWDKYPDPNALLNQRFLVSKRPGPEKNYCIFDLFYGVPIGLFDVPGDKGSQGRYLSVCPSSAGNWDHSFRFREARDGWRWIIRPWTSEEGPRTRVWDVETYENHGWMFMNQWRDEPDDNTQHWKLELDQRVDSPDYTVWPIAEYRRPLSTAGWMARVPDDTRLCQMSIPGTHQSLALHGAQQSGLPHLSFPNFGRDNPRCQNRTPFEQLYEGIRYFDLRFDLWTTTKNDFKSLFARHGDSLKGLAGVNEGYSLMAVLHSFKVFLAYNAGETLIVNVTRETDADETDFWIAFFRDILFFQEDYPQMFYRDRSRKDMTQVKIGDCRGKIIFTCDGARNIMPKTSSEFGFQAFEFFDSVVLDGNFYSAEFKAGGKRFDEGMYDMPTDKWDQKLSQCRDNINLALDESPLNSDAIFKTAWNGSLLVGTTSPYDPIDFATYASRGASNARIGQVLNPDRLGRGTTDRWRRVGLVVFDFYELAEQSIEAVIRSNRGCGDLVDFPKRPLKEGNTQDNFM